MAAAEEVAAAAADGALEQPSSSDEEQTVAMPSQVEQGEQQPRGPFTPGREPDQ